MFRHYFKTAWRSLLRSKGFSVINIVGLAIGMASALLIILWLQNMISMDRFHDKKDRLYVMANRDVFSGQMHAWTTTPIILGPTLLQNYPQVERMSRVSYNNSGFLFTIGEKKINAGGAYVDTSFLKMFSFPLTEGKISDALNSENKIVLTEKFAKSLFGNEDPMGKTLKLDTSIYVTVSGVLKDLPINTQINFQFLLSMDFLKKNRKDSYDEAWSDNQLRTYILLKPNTDITSFNTQIQDITINHTKGNAQPSTTKVFAFPFTKNYLYNEDVNGEYVTGRIVLVRMFAVIAAFILLIACINFMNLSTARSEKRAKEVGVRKVVGAHRSSLILQFIFESFFITFIAFALAIIIVLVSLSFFDKLVDVQLKLSFSNIYNWVFALAFIVFTGLLAGSYPAFFLSSFQPVKVLKGTFRRVHSKINLRSVLVVIQFTFAIILIVSTIIVTRQIRYTQERDNGYNRNGLVYSYMSGKIQHNYLLIKNEMLQSGAVTSVTKSMSPITAQYSDSWGYTWRGSTEEDKKLDFGKFSSDADFVKTMQSKLIEGRDIDIYHYPTDSTAILLNETAVKKMRLTNPVGLQIRELGDSTTYHVIGVIKDFIIQDVSSKVDAMMVFGPNSWFSNIHYRLNPARSTQNNLDIIKGIFKKYNSEYPFEYTFASEDYAQKFKETQKIGELSTLFAGLTIFISCLGLLGLVMFIAETKTKEIGIRKVLGASIFNITTLLSKDFLKLVIISFIIAAPIAWYAMNKWLMNYDYRVSIQWWWFILAGIMAIIIAIVTMSWQAIKAARVNPVKSLKTE